MTNNLLTNNNFFDYGILIGCALILGCSLYYLSTNNINNNTAIPSNNIEAIIDSDSDSDSTDSQSISDNESLFDSASSSDFEGILNNTDIMDLYFIQKFRIKYSQDVFVMPDVDLNVCPIEELKLFEFCSLYSKQILEKSITELEVMEFICSFSKEDLATN